MTNASYRFDRGLRIMADKGRLWERRAASAGALVLALLVLCAGYRVLRTGAGRFFGDFFDPYLRLARLGVSQLSDASLLAYSRAELAAKLEALQRQNRGLALQAAAAGELLQENEELRKLVEFSSPGERVYLPAEIVLRDPVMWRERFTVDRGERDGVRAGAAVIDVSPDGRPLLVGVVERVGKRSSTVLTLYNGALRLSARLGASGAVGFVNAGAERGADGTLPVGYLPLGVDYPPGEAAVTTGFESGIPPGLVIGEMISVDAPGPVFSPRMHLSGRLKPAADFDGLRFVVIAGTRQTAERL